MSDNIMAVKDLVRRRDDVMHVDVWYPQVNASCRAVEISLMDVRAANSLRVHYDHDRDGWVVSMEGVICHDGYSEGTGKYAEQAFVPAWATEVEPGG